MVLKVSFSTVLFLKQSRNNKEYAKYSTSVSVLMDDFISHKTVNIMLNKALVCQFG